MDNTSCYPLGPEQVEAFHRDGFVHLPHFLDEQELCLLDEVYDRFMSGEIPVEGRDRCDMGAKYGGQGPANVANVMLPRRYFPAWCDNVYELRARQVTEGLLGKGFALDYDQLVAKPPGALEGEFPWHQDLAYWPRTPDPRTASFWLAMDSSTIDNGCLNFVAGSHREPALRRHRAVFDDRNENHALACDVNPDVDDVRPTPITRGSVTVHAERTIHGSLGNSTDGWRRAYVLAFRTGETVDLERAMGFTHSHNDDLSVLNSVGVRGESR